MKDTTRVGWGVKIQYSSLTRNPEGGFPCQFGVQNFKEKQGAEKEGMIILKKYKKLKN
jgi:hypothetical protein